MDTSHLVTEVELEDVEFEEVYDEGEIKSSINEILGANSSLEESSEDWMHNVSEEIETVTERYYSAAVNYINRERSQLKDEAEDMAETLHRLDQSLEFLSMSTGAVNRDYRNRMLEIKNRLEKEVVAPLTAAALENGQDFTEEIPDPEADYLLRPVKSNYLE